MKNAHLILIPLLIILLSACTIPSFHSLLSNPDNQAADGSSEEKTVPSRVPPFSEPLNKTVSRVTKKPFGIKITKDNSPVSPERFSGYHTGVDFEVSENELETDVSIYAICDGPLVLKKYASGYGGVAVQQCKIDNTDVTVVYGHLKSDSISAKTGQNLNYGEKIGILGKGYSSETDGERKHLHLSIHKGTSVNILGYVQVKSQLDGWMDPLTLLK